MAGLAPISRRDDLRSMADGGVERWDPSVGRWRAQAQPEVSTSRAIATMADALAPAGGEVVELQDRVAGPASMGTQLEFIGPNYTGRHVSEARAWTVAAVWASMDVIASSLASSDWNVYAGVRGADSGKAALPEDNTQFLLNTRPNPEMTALSAKRALLMSAIGYGNGYAEIEWDLAGRVYGIWPILPDRVEQRRDEFGRMFYRVAQSVDGRTVDLDPVDVLHIRGSSLVGFRGENAIARAIQSIAMNVALDEFAAAYYGNGTNLGGLLTIKGKLDDEAWSKMQQRWSQRHQGARKSFKTGILEGGATYQPLDSNAQKADITAWKASVIEECARWFRVPPHKIGHLLHATNNNIEHQGLEFTRDTLRPWQCEIEQEADYKLMPARGPRKFVEIDLDWASQGDYASRMTAYQSALNTGVFNINTVLRKLGENTIGADGERRLVQGAMVPLADVGKAAAAAREAGGGGDEGGTAGGRQPPGQGGGRPPEASVVRAWLASIYARGARRDRCAESADRKRYLSDALADMARELFDLSEARDPVAIAIEHGLPAMAGEATPDDAAAGCIAALTKETDA